MYKLLYSIPNSTSRSLNCVFHRDRNSVSRLGCRPCVAEANSPSFRLRVAACLVPKINIINISVFYYYFFTNLKIFTHPSKIIAALRAAFPQNRRESSLINHGKRNHVTKSYHKMFVKKSPFARR